MAVPTELRPVLDAAPSGFVRPAALRRFASHRPAVLGAVFLAATAAGCFLGLPHAQDPDLQRLSEPISGPSLRHWFGTDELSRDLLARVLRGGQVSLSVGVGVALVATAIGTAVGAVAGFYRGRLDEALMRLVDVLLIIPLLPLAIVLSSFDSIGPVAASGRLGVTLVLALWMWAPLARIVRGTVLELREAGFVEGARAAGASNARIIVRHVLPNAAGPILVSATLAAAAAILIESAMSFLGFGAKPPDASWGSLLSGSVGTMERYPWLTVFPGLAIFLTVMAVNFVGDGIRDALDPHQRPGGRS